MFNFFGRRVSFIILVLLCIVFFTHLGMQMVNNSDARRADYDAVSQSQRAWDQSQTFLSGVVRGNFGYVETSYGLVRVRDIAVDAYINSMGLLLSAMMLATFFGLLAGAFAALTKRKMWVLPVLTITVIGISTPSFFAGLLLRQGEIYYLKIFGKTLVSVAGFGWDYKHMLLPVLVLAARPIAHITRAAFMSFNHIMDEDYIRTAFSKGLTKNQTVSFHAVRNVAVPLLTAIGVSLRFSLSSLPVVEFLFVWPGMGLGMLEGINQRETALVVTLAALMGLTFLVVNFLLDISYRFIDPRIRESNEAA
jgi:peptide/nickel transport system permease protein